MQFSDVFADTNKYFHTVSQYLAEFEWIYNFQPTCFFASKVWEQLPKEWEEVLLGADYRKLCGILYGHAEDGWPNTLKEFICTGESFILDREIGPDQEQNFTIEKELQRGMTPKKKHEVIKMATFIHQALQRTPCDVILDVGAGLGYLDEVLYHTYGYKVVGIESSVPKSHSAETRFKKSSAETKCVALELQDDISEEQIFHILSSVSDFGLKMASEVNQLSNVKTTNEDHLLSEEKDFSNSIKSLHKDCHLDPATTSKALGDLMCPKSTIDSYQSKCELSSCSKECNEMNGAVAKNNLDLTFSELQSSSQQKLENVSSLPSPVVCMIGLHSCGDLVPIMLKMMPRLQSMHLLLCVGCCYHKMKSEGDAGTDFPNFPMSSDLKSALHSTRLKFSDWKLNVFALRLAAQETRVRWKQQSAADHETRMRHIIYRAVLEAFMEKEGVKLAKAYRRAARKRHFLTFDAYIEAVYTRFNVSDEMKIEMKDKMKKMFEECRPFFPYVQVIWTLQTLLQGVLESLILLDRYSFLKEQDVEAKLIPIFDDFISPRNFVLCGWKNSTT